MINKTRRVLALAMVLSMALALVPTGFTLATDADITLTSVMRQAEPITLYSTDSSQISTLDPQLASDTVSINAIENLFLGLTDTDPLQAGAIRPEIATEWTVSDDGLTWTFTLRDDIPWVKWDPVADEATVLRNITAADVEYGMKRACDPRLNAYYGNILAGVLLGCDEVISTPVDDFTEADFDKVAVTALDDTTVQVTLKFAAGYFQSMTPMWMMRPVPQEVIDEFGDNWTEPGNIVTSGAFVMDEWVRGVRRVYYANPFFPADMRGPGNLERIITTVVEDQGTRFALYQDDQVDVGPVPSAELQSILEDPAYADQLIQISDLAVFYLAFAHDKAPFDNVNARRAFNAALDRGAFIQQAQQGRGLPMIHFTPPGMFGAPPINEVGVGFDPEYAAAQMAEAGYPNCEGFPNLEIVTYTGAGTWAEFMAAGAETHLGCDPNIFTIEQQEFSVLLETVDPANPAEDRPNMWSLGWGPDYGDANNWVGDVVHCEFSENSFKRPCTETDDLIELAAQESDPDARIELYYRIEEQLFGPEGEVPFIPIYLRVDYSLVKPWYTAPFETDGLFGGAHWDWRTIDQEAQLAARGA